MDPIDAAEMQLWVERLGVDRSEFLRDAVRGLLLKLKSEADAETWAAVPFTEAELALRAIANWGPAENWSDWANAEG